MGLQKSDSWAYLNEAGWRIDNLDRLDKQIKEFLNNLTIEAVQDKKNAATKRSSEIEDDVRLAYNKLYHFLSTER